jgi:hypothetical protein
MRSRRRAMRGLDRWLVVRGFMAQKAYTDICF